MKKWKDLLFAFVCVTTCVVFVTAVYITIFWQQATLGVEILWQILTVSFLCSLGIYIYPEREVSGKTEKLLYILHYIISNVVVLGCGVWFGWFDTDNLPMVLGMVIAVALVFLLVSIVMWKRNQRTAALMNERLKEYQQKDSRFNSLQGGEQCQSKE